MDPALIAAFHELEAAGFDFDGALRAEFMRQVMAHAWDVPPQPGAEPAGDERVTFWVRGFVKGWLASRSADARDGVDDAGPAQPVA